MQPPSCTLQERHSSPLPFDQDILAHSTKRRAYLFVLKTSRVFLIPTSKVGIR